MKIIKKLFYRLGGADYDVISNCSSKTKLTYLSLAFALILTTLLAGVGGYDIAAQFTPSLSTRIIVALGLAIAVFSFDFIIINGPPQKGIFQYNRILAGIANIFITIIALLILLNQATIGNNEVV